MGGEAYREATATLDHGRKGTVLWFGKCVGADGRPITKIPKRQLASILTTAHDSEP